MNLCVVKQTPIWRELRCYKYPLSINPWAETRKTNESDIRQTMPPTFLTKKLHHPSSMNVHKAFFEFLAVGVSRLSQSLYFLLWLQLSLSGFWMLSWMRVWSDSSATSMRWEQRFIKTSSTPGLKFLGWYKNILNRWHGGNWLCSRLFSCTSLIIFIHRFWKLSRPSEFSCCVS